MTRLSYVMALV